MMLSFENPALKTENLQVYYGDHHAFFDGNLEFEKNKITALIGPSGCGKSTFLRSLNRMNDKVANVTGKIWYRGVDINAKDINVYEVRKHIGMVFQRPNPFAKSIRENITYALKANGLNDKEELDKRVEESLKQAAVWDEVKDDLHKSALAFSGGQQQRICIARVLAVHPKVILMDEPTSALDPISSSKIEDTLLKLKNDYSIIIVTHNMQQASRISDRTALLLNGDLIEYDCTEEMFLRPKEKITDDYLNGRFG
ncbi:MAG: phosphate ABC transporter ATP-binding protein PstB [Ligilactobacillus ruminis]